MRRNVRVLGPLACLMLAVTLFAQQRMPPDGSGLDERFFVEKVYPVFEKAECRMCHNDNGVSSATRLRFPPPDAKTEAVQVFGLKLSALVDRRNPPQSLLLNKPTLRVPHTGGERIAKDSPEEEVVRSWATHLAALTDGQIKASIERLAPGRREPDKPAIPQP